MSLRMNFTPSSMVITTEKLPMVLLLTLLEIQLPTNVSSRTNTIITLPF